MIFRKKKEQEPQKHYVDDVYMYVDSPVCFGGYVGERIELGLVINAILEHCGLSLEVSRGYKKVLVKKTNTTTEKKDAQTK